MVASIHPIRLIVVSEILIFVEKPEQWAVEIQNMVLVFRDAQYRGSDAFCAGIYTMNFVAMITVEVPFEDQFVVSDYDDAVDNAIGTGVDFVDHLIEKR